MKEFHPFRDMKESAKAQHEIDKAEFEAVKAESKANREEAKLLSKSAKLKAKKEHDDRMNARTAAAKERIDAAKKAKEELQ